jgi:multicomponent Na+:H+ antiporter subunit B
MNMLILRTTTRLLMGLLLIFSVFLLLRGHNLPGGGFSGGLVAASAFALQALGFGVHAARRQLHFDPRTLIAFGLLVALGGAVWSLFYGQPFFTGMWDKTPLPVIGKLGTPLLFDAGVYFVVIGVVLEMVFTFAETDADGNRKELD